MFLWVEDFPSSLVEEVFSCIIPEESITDVPRPAEGLCPADTCGRQKTTSEHLRDWFAETAACDGNSTLLMSLLRHDMLIRNKISGLKELFM